MKIQDEDIETLYTALRLAEMALVEVRILVPNAVLYHCREYANLTAEIAVLLSKVKEVRNGLQSAAKQGD